MERGFLHYSEPQPDTFVGSMLRGRRDWAISWLKGSRPLSGSAGSYIDANRVSYSFATRESMSS
jgi:hypothetical protein